MGVIFSEGFIVAVGNLAPTVKEEGLSKYGGERAFDIVYFGQFKST